MRAWTLLLIALVVVSGTSALQPPDATSPPAAEKVPEGPSGSLLLASTASPNASTSGAFDPEGPWHIGDTDIHASAGGHELTVSGPLVVVSEQGVVDGVLVRAPSGTVLARILCEQGACTVSWPDGEQTVPGATIVVDGPWRHGRATGARLLAADGALAVQVSLFGDTGARLAGDTAPFPVSLTPGLVLEGDTRDPDRVALRAPDGPVVLDVRPGGSSLAAIQLIDRALVVDQLSARLFGDPFSDETVTLELVVEGQARRYELDPTLAGAFGAASEAGSDHVVLASPTRLGEASLELTAGPATLTHEDGSLSPRYPLLARLAVANGSGYERAWLVVDGQQRVAFTLSGMDGEQRVFHGELAQGLLPLRHGAVVELSTQLERDLAPGLVQSQGTDVLRVSLDLVGPAPPGQPTADRPGRLAWQPMGEAGWYEAQARPAGQGDWRAIPVNGTSAQAPSEPAGPWEGRVRGVDEQGNPGEWSEVITWTSTGGGEPAASPQLDLQWPLPGSRLQGTVELSWTPSESVALVTVSVSRDGGASWTEVGSSSQPPLAWDTRSLPDGLYLLRVNAQGPGGSATRLVEDVSIDNLAPVAPGDQPPGPFDGGGAPTPDGDPTTSFPLPMAAASLLLLLGLSGAVVGVHRRKGKD